MKKQSFLMVLGTALALASFSMFGMSSESSSQFRRPQSQQEQVELDQQLLESCAEDDNPLDFVQTAVQLGANVNARNAEGQTPLFLAAYSDNLPLIKFLVHHGAHVNTHNSAGTTLVRFAQLNNDEALVHFLVLNGAKVDDAKLAVKILLG